MPDNFAWILRNLYNTLSQCLPDKVVVCQNKRTVKLVMISSDLSVLNKMLFDGL